MENDGQEIYDSGCRDRYIIGIPKKNHIKSRFLVA